MTTEKNVETLVDYMQDFTKYMASDERVAATIMEYQSMTEETRIRSELDMKRKWNGICNHLIFSTSMIYSLDIYSGNELIYTYYDDPTAASENNNIPAEIIDQALHQSAPIWTERS